MRARWTVLCLGLWACDDGSMVEAPAPDAGAALDAAPVVDAAPVDGGPMDAALPPCVPVVPPAAEQLPGPGPDGTWLTVGGRGITPAGPNTVVPGFATTVVLHLERGVAYVASSSNDDRRVLVVSLETHEVLQDVDRGESFFGLALSPDGTVLYASAGVDGRVDAYAVQPDGTLVLEAAAETGGYPAGVVVAPDGATLWVGMFDTPTVVEIDAATLEETRRFITAGNVWELLHLPRRGELYASTLHGEAVSVIDLAAGAMVADIPLPTSPAGLVADADERRVWAAVSGADMIAALDPETRAVTDWAHVTEPGLLDAAGEPLGNVNVNALAYDAATDRLYASRGADNAVSVLDAGDLSLLGSIPTAWYPTDLALGPDGLLVVSEGKGGGGGPSEGRSAKNQMKGSVTFVALGDLDLEASTAQVRANFGRPRAVFPFACDAGRFPIPTRPDRPSPIEHVVLIVKENKTFDCVFGDLGDLDVDVDPALLRWGEEITPNLHALARSFALSDSFFTEVENSDAGHLLLTGMHLTEFVERIWVEKARVGRFQGFQLTDPAIPDVGNLFTHLMDHDVSLRIYGEIVGMFLESKTGKGRPSQHSDAFYPGGAFYNTNEPDENKARYVVERIEAGELAAFTFLLLPNDHTEGTRPGSPTPESMVADNDFAVGLVVDALSKSPFWPKTAIIILQDDPQGCEDHVDVHRSPLLVVSPYARRAHVSHVHTSFMSVFATIEAILGVPPLGRPDAAASPLWDMFTADVDLSGYDAIPRRIPEAMNPPDAPGAEKSRRMNFQTPDREAGLAPLLDAYRLWKMGRITRAEADARMARPVLTEARRELLEEEAEEETTAFDQAWAKYQAWRATQGLAPARLNPRGAPRR